eukprot:42541_1
MTAKNIIESKVKNARDWYWFKTYLLPSTIWFRSKNINDYIIDKTDEKETIKETINNSNRFKNCLYEELLFMIKQQSNIITNELRIDIKKMSDKSQTEWNALCNLQTNEYVLKCRQDKVQNGVGAKYSFDELLSLSSGFKSFNAISHYDRNEYLSDLVLLAHIVDDQFQNDIKNTFSNFSTINKLYYKYQRGPVKLLSRCKSKAEGDYRLEPFPTSACLLDLNRCTILFDDISNLLQGLQLFANAIKSKNAGCVVDIVREKNTFMEYTHDNPQYADVKFNVLIHHTKKNISIVGEVQFLLKTMMNFKKSAHNLYEITRNQEYVENVMEVLEIVNDKNKMIFVAGNLGDVNSLCELMVAHNKTPKDLLIVDPASKESIVVNIIALQKQKALYFLKSICASDLFKDRVFLVNRYDISGFQYCLHLQLWPQLKVLLESESVCKTMKANNWNSIWEGILLQDEHDFDMELAEMVLNNPYFEKNIKLKRYLSCKSLGNLIVFKGDIHWQLFRMVFAFDEIKQFIKQNLIQTVAVMLCQIGKNYGNSYSKIKAYLEYIEMEIIQTSNEAQTDWNLYIHFEQVNIGNMLQFVVKYSNTKEFCKWIISQQNKQHIISFIMNGTEQQNNSPFILAASSNNIDFLDLIFEANYNGLKVTANNVFTVSKACNIDVLNILMSHLCEEEKLKLKTDWKLVWKDIPSVYRYILDVIQASDGNHMKLKFLMENIFLIDDNDDMKDNDTGTDENTLEQLFKYNDNDKCTILLYAMMNKKYNEVEYLYDVIKSISGKLLVYNLNYQNNMEKAMILLCCSNSGQLELLKKIVSAGSVNVLSKTKSDGTTSFQIACSKGFVKCAEVILNCFENNKDKLDIIDYKNENGKTALDLCKVCGRKGKNYNAVEKQIDCWKKQFT